MSVERNLESRGLESPRQELSRIGIADDAVLQLPERFEIVSLVGGLPVDVSLVSLEQAANSSPIASPVETIRCCFN